MSKIIFKTLKCGICGTAKTTSYVEEGGFAALEEQMARLHKWGWSPEWKWLCPKCNGPISREVVV